MWGTSVHICQSDQTFLLLDLTPGACIPLCPTETKDREKGGRAEGKVRERLEVCGFCMPLSERHWSCWTQRGSFLGPWGPSDLILTVLPHRECGPGS